MPILTFLSNDQLPSLSVRVVSKTTTVVTLAWNKVPNAQGYLFFKNGAQISRTFNPNMTSTRFSYVSGDSFAVEAITFQALAQGQIKI